MPTLCGERVNLSVYKQRSIGAVVRVAGRFHAAGVLTTTDAGLIFVEIGSLTITYTWKAGMASFVEVVGMKITDDRMRAMGIVHLQSGEVDEDLWNEAIMVAQSSALRHLFAPYEGRNILAEGLKAELYEQQPLAETQEYGSRVDSGEGLCSRVHDGRAFVGEGESQGGEQQVLSPTQLHGLFSERDAELDAELDALLSAAGSRCQVSS